MRRVRTWVILTIMAVMTTVAAQDAGSADQDLREKAVRERDREAQESKERENLELVRKKSKSADTFMATAGKMIRDGSDGKASDLLKTAREMKGGADADIRSQDYVQASKKLDASINAALQAIAIVVKGGSVRDAAVKETERDDAENRKKTYRDAMIRKRMETEVFIETARRLLKERDNKEAAGFLKESIGRMETAERLAAGGELEKAVESLNESFSLAVSAVRTMRENHVVVHRMVFKSHEEEFVYEKENNETYLLMALPVVKGGTESAKQKINEARELRKRSEEKAILKNYSGAVKEIKLSNGLLITTIEGFDAKTGRRR